MPESGGLNLHEDVVLFREAINFTAARTGGREQLEAVQRRRRGSRRGLSIGSAVSSERPSLARM